MADVELEAPVGSYSYLPFDNQNQNQVLNLLWGLALGIAALVMLCMPPMGYEQHIAAGFL